MRKFLMSDRGNVAMMFGLMVVPILAIAGIALDMMRTNSIRTQVIEATDAGLLAAVRAKSLNPKLTDADMEAIALKVFGANSNAAFTKSSFKLNKDTESGAYSVVVNGNVDTLLLSVVGYDKLDVNSFSEAKVAPPRRLELALVLDNTFSMNGAKIDALQTSASDLVDTLMVDGGTSVLISVVPFARHVNVGIGQKFASWLDAPADSSYEGNACTTDTAATEAEGCKWEEDVCTNDGTSFSCHGWQCPSGKSVVSSCAPVVQETAWLGCVSSRNYPLNIKDIDYAVDRVPGVLNHKPNGVDCPGVLLPLSDDKTKVMNAIDSMITQGETYIPAGLSWGYRVLSPAEPYSDGYSYEKIASEFGEKVLVLMTDGENTASPDFGGPGSGHYQGDIAQADTYTTELCDEIKANNISIFTIAFEVDNATTIDLLKNCATTADAFFDASDSSQLAAAFNEIATSLIELSLTK